MYRQHQGLTQADLAKLLKVSATQVARWEAMSTALLMR